jgi:HD superfamily phosphohydrolase
LHRHYIVDKDPKIRAALLKMGISPWMVQAVWNAKPNGEKSVVNDYCEVLAAIIQGPLGADRIDFIMRDSYYTGTSHLGTIAHIRIIDHAWISDASPISPKWAKSTKKMSLMYSEKVLGDIVHALNGRQYMYSNVYLHKTATAGSILIEEVLEKLPDLVDRTMDLERFVFLNDMVIQEALALPEIGEMAKRYLLRQLPKEVFRCRYAIGSGISPEDQRRLDEFSDQSVYRTVTSRQLVGMDPQHFDKYNILFGTENGLQTCSESIQSIGFISSTPYQVVSVFKL